MMMLLALLAAASLKQAVLERVDEQRVVARLIDVARGAALMTGTEMSHVVAGDAHEVLPHRALSLLIHGNLALVGPPSFGEEEKAFARETQKDMDPVPPRALSETIEAVPETPTQRAHSTDQGDLSWHVPTGGLSVASYTFGAPGHSWQVAACSGMSIGEKAMTVAAKVLAATALDLMTQPPLLAQARASFREVRGPLTFTSLLPRDARAPAAIRTKE